VDVNAVSDVGVYSIPNRRTDTRVPGSVQSTGPVVVDGVPVWPPYVPHPPIDGVAALTGAPADATVTARPMVAVKIDNYPAARPQWGLAQADAVIEINAEGITRFIALYHTQMPRELGPVRSARTGDVDLLAAMNRPVFAYSGANVGVSTWIASAASSGVLVDFTAQRNGCYAATRRVRARTTSCSMPCAPPPRERGRTRTPALDDRCELDRGADRRPVGLDSSFSVPMDGVVVQWAWDAAAGVYRRFQDGRRT
jgi:hypothetical protein